MALPGANELTVLNMDLGLVVLVFLLYWMFLIILCTC